MSLENLPVEWKTTDIGQLVDDMFGGLSPKTTDYQVSGVLALNKGDIKQSGTLKIKNSANYLSDNFIGSNTDKIVQKNDVLVTLRDLSQKADFLGLVALYKGSQKAVITQGMYKLLLNNALDRRYLMWYSNSPLYRLQVKNEKVGATQVHLRNDQFKDLNIPLPPIAEQQEIVRQLDVMLAQVEQIKTRLDAIPAILKKFRQSVLADAVSGKLINQDFSSLGFLKLESLILDSGNGLSKRKGDSGNEVTVLRLADFKDAQRVFGNERSILLTEKELLKYKLLQNDILVVRVNGSVDIAGKFILHKDNEKDEAYCDHFIRLRIDQQKLLPEYLLYIANEGSGRDYLVNSLSTSAGQNTINQASIKGLQLRVPEIKYQDMIIQTVEKLFKHSFKIEETVLSTQKRVNLLTQSILAKAFSGELTAEWREQHQDLITGVNSAEALLAKIQAEREASKPVKKAKKVK